MYPMRFPTCYLLVVLFYFGAAEPPPTHGYGPPSPVEFNSNEVASHEYKSPVTDFGNYGSFSSGSSSGYAAPNTNYAKPSSNFAPNFGGTRSGFPTYKSGGKNGVSSSYISIVHGPGGAASPSKQRPVAYAGPAKGQSSAALYKSSNFAPASFGEGSATSGFSSDEISTYFGKGFGAAPSSQYKESSGGYDFAPPRNPGRKQQQGADYEGGASDEVGSYSSGGPSYATFSGSKPSYNPSSTFSGSSHGGSRGNAYSTSNVHFGSGGGKVSSGHGNFHPPSFVGSFKPSSTKAYNRYSSPTGGNYQQVTGSGSSSSYGVAPLVGSETAFNSRALKGGYTSEHVGKNANEFSGEDAGSNNYFAGFGDGAGFKVQSSYSTG